MATYGLFFDFESYFCRSTCRVKKRIIIIRNDRVSGGCSRKTSGGRGEDRRTGGREAKNTTVGPAAHTITVTCHGHDRLGAGKIRRIPLRVRLSTAASATAASRNVYDVINN